MGPKSTNLIFSLFGVSFCLTYCIIIIIFINIINFFFCNRKAMMAGIELPDLGSTHSLYFYLFI